MKSKILICLALILFAGGSGWFWYHIISPQQLLAEAESLAPKHSAESLKLLQEAIFRSRSGKFPEAELLRVKILILSGRRDEALGAYSLIENPKQLPAKKLLEVGRLAQESGLFYLSELAFEDASTDPVDQAVALRALIQVLLYTRQEQKALGFVDQLLEIESQEPLAWQIRGTIETNQRHLSEAEDAFRECLQLSLNQEQEQNVRESLIQVLLDQGKLKEARHQIDTYLSEFARTNRVSLAEAYLLRLEGQPEKGLKLITPLCEMNHPKRIKALYLRGLLQFDLKQHEKAIKDWKVVIENEPWHKEAHSKLASSYRTLDQIELAEVHARTAEDLTQKSLRLLDLTHQLSQDPGNHKLRQEVIRLNRTLGKFEQALKFQ